MYCPNCGKKIDHDTVSFCPNCGSAISTEHQFAEQTYAAANNAPRRETGLQTAAKVLMIISTVFMGFWLIPLAWCIPMTVSYCNKLKSGEPVSTGFKVCSLLFVSLIAGILMLCDDN